MIKSVLHAQGTVLVLSGVNLPDTISKLFQNNQSLAVNQFKENFSSRPEFQIKFCLFLFKTL